MNSVVCNIFFICMVELWIFGVNIVWIFGYVMGSKNSLFYGRGNWLFVGGGVINNSSKNDSVGIIMCFFCYYNYLMYVKIFFYVKFILGYVYVRLGFVV